MNTSRKHAAWVSAGLMLTLIAGSPVYADDTELLVANPTSLGADKPNILFILDSSGSMTTLESTQEPYDNSIVYSGSCDTSKLYWTRATNPPDCDTDDTIDLSSFVCAQGIAQMATAGLYADTMAQYRARRGSDRWRTLRRGRDDRLVECESDSGIHGDGPVPSGPGPVPIGGDVYAQIGSDLPPFTSDPTREVAWGSSPTHRFYTMYSANYMNWFHNTPVVSLSRTEIVKAVTKNVLGSISNVNVGFMRFNWDQGGPVTRAVKDLDATRAQAIADIDALPAAGYTPLSETMYEAALYWRGMQADYGGAASTDPDALASTGPMVYDNPANFACAKNFTVLLTDGAPTRDTDAYSKVPSLPNFVTTMGRSNCTGGNVNGACLDDVAEYMSKEDLNSSVPGIQTATTYTIGFSVDLPILKETAENSGGEYYLADDVASLTTALTDIVSNIFDRAVSFTAPAVSVNAFNRTQHLNELYISVFQASNSVHWPGNMKKYTINDGKILDAADAPAVDPATGFFKNNSLSYWTAGPDPDGSDVNVGGALENIPPPTLRNVYTNVNGSNLSASANHISTSNSGSFQLSDFGLLGAPGDPVLDDVLNWVRGADIADIDNDATTTIRKQMGDTLHSQPASIVYGGTPGALDVVVYAATNDGQLHAFDADTGEELWSFIPQELLSNIGDLFFDDVASFKHYGIDGDLVPVVIDQNHNGQIETGDKVYLVFGMRRGGDNYYMIDVTNKTAPVLRWIKNYPEFGQTWSSPVPALVKLSPSVANDAVLILGAGYDTTHDAAGHPSSPDAEGAGIFMLDLENGNEVWRAGSDGAANLPLAVSGREMDRSIPSSIRVLDMTGDGYADRMYAADLGGQLWRFDIDNGSTANNLVAGGVIAQLGAEGIGSPGAAETRRFFAAPDISMFEDPHHQRRYLAVSLGSGYRAHPLDKSAADRFYSIRDPDVFNQLTQTEYDNYSVITDASLVDVTGQVNVTLNPADRGWKFVLPSGEKVLSESRTFDDTIYFVSFEPDISSTDPCQAGQSVNRLYRVSVMNGNPVIDLSTVDPTDPDAVDDARVINLQQGGIAPKPTFLFPSPLDPDCEGADCAPPPIGCVGVECFDPGFPNNPVRTLWTQDGVN